MIALVFANILTQVILYILIDALRNATGIIIGEIIAFVFEAIFYAFVLKPKNVKKAVLYAVTANCISLIFGLILIR